MISASEFAAFLSPDSLLITDFDGTIAPIVAFPAHARAIPGALLALSRIADAIGQVVILTGRTRLSLLVALGDDVPENVRILCNYGADDPLHPLEVDTAPIAALLQQLTAMHGQLPEGVMVEEKGTSIALHTRGCREPDASLAQIGMVIGPVAHELGLDLQQGRDVIDVGIRLGGKAATVRRLLTERTWSSVVMFGDDHSDLDAFDVLGQSATPSLTIGVESEEVPGVGLRSDRVLASPIEVTHLLVEVSTILAGQSR